jgi:hypothetical protein
VLEASTVSIGAISVSQLVRVLPPGATREVVNRVLDSPVQFHVSLWPPDPWTCDMLLLMWIWQALVIALACSASLVAAQTKTNPPPEPAARIISLTGCIVRDETRRNEYSLSDAKEGVYRLTGMKFSDYVGQHVRVAGAVRSTRLVIKGGLLPNANVAAQAGSIDPVQAAMANAGGAAGPGTVQLPEFRVKGITPVAGGCPN